MKNNRIAFIAIVISLIAIAFTFLRITPFEVSNDIYVGLIATFIGVSVTLVIGFQIINTLEIRKEISEQKKLSTKLEQMHNKLNKTIEIQKNTMQEGFDMIDTLIEYQENGSTYSINAFKSLHHALVSSLKTGRTEYEWIFDLLRKYIADINWQNFVGGFSEQQDGSFKCSTPNSPHYNKDLKDIVKEYTDKVDEDEKTLRENENFCRIKMEYDRVMKLYRKRIADMLENPNTFLTTDEKKEITNPN